MCFLQFGAYPNHTHIQIIVKNKIACCEKERKEKEKKTEKTEKKNTTAKSRD
jgi:hypothetical protein